MATSRRKKYSTSQKRVWGFKPSLIYNELRDSFVAIVTESAFSVTGIVTEMLRLSEGRIVNNPLSLAKEKK